jgi:UDP-N-acetylglucosamine 2-epimerase
MSLHQKRERLVIVKVVGRKDRLQRTVDILSHLNASDSKTACVCQNDLLRQELQQRGFNTFSFWTEVGRQTDRIAWAQAVDVKERLQAVVARSKFEPDGYRCAECLVGVDLDQYAFLAAVILVSKKLTRKSFRRVILLPEEEYANLLPDDSNGIYHVHASRGPIDWLRNFAKRYLPLLPFLLVFNHTPVYDDCVLYRETPERRLQVHSQNGTRVLIVVADTSSFQGYYARPAVAIAKACLERGDEVLVMANRYASDSFSGDMRFEGLKCQQPLVSAPISEWEQSLRVQRILSKQRSAPASWQEAWRLACNLVREKSGTIIARSIRNLRLVSRIVDEFRPHVLVVIPDSLNLGIAAVSVARKNGVPSITTLAGQISDHPQYGNLFADMIAVNNDEARRIFVKRGIEPHRITVTGMAHLDQTFRYAKGLPIRAGSPFKLILFATENLPIATTIKMLEPVIQFVSSNSQMKLVIRPHPREIPGVYKDFIAKLRNANVLLDTATPLLELLSKADICVTGSSNVAVDAMILNRPVVCLNFGGISDKLGYVRSGAALGVTQVEQTGSVLRKALFDHRTRDRLTERRAVFLKRNFHGADASLRIAKPIERVASDSRISGAKKIKPE